MKSPADFDQRLTELYKRLAQSMRKGDSLFAAINQLHASADRQIPNSPSHSDWPNKT